MVHEGDMLHGARLEQQVQNMGSMFEAADLQVSVSEEVQGAIYGISALAMDVVLAELFENARKFHPEGKPKVMVTAKRTETGECEIQLIDDGQQVGPEILEYIGKPYFQVK